MVPRRWSRRRGHPAREQTTVITRPATCPGGRATVVRRRRDGDVNPTVRIGRGEAAISGIIGYCHPVLRPIGRHRRVLLVVVVMPWRRLVPSSSSSSGGGGGGFVFLLVYPLRKKPLGHRGVGGT